MCGNGLVACRPRGRAGGHGVEGCESDACEDLRRCCVDGSVKRECRMEEGGGSVEADFRLLQGGVDIEGEWRCGERWW